MKKKNRIMWLKLLSQLYEDQRLNVWHTSLLTGIILLAIEQDNISTIYISRKKLMQKAHIPTIPTYHKYMKELQEMNIMIYVPSYHPGYRSTVRFNAITK